MLFVWKCLRQALAVHHLGNRHKRNVLSQPEDKATPTGTPPVLSQKQQEALAGSQAILGAQDQHLDFHRALTLAFLVLLAGHVLVQLIY